MKLLTIRARAIKAMTSVEESSSKSSFSGSNSSPNPHEVTGVSPSEGFQSNGISQENNLLDPKASTDHEEPYPPKATSKSISTKSFKSSIADKSSQAQDFLNQSKSLTIQNSQDLVKSNMKLGFWKEWESLLIKILLWTGIKVPSNPFKFSVNPSLLIIGLLAVLISLKAYSSTLNTLRLIPIAPSIFKVVGAFWLIRFSIIHLLRQNDRKQLILEAQDRWKTFSGQS